MAISAERKQVEGDSVINAYYMRPEKRRKKETVRIDKVKSAAQFLKAIMLFIKKRYHPLFSGRLKTPFQISILITENAGTIPVNTLS